MINPDRTQSPSIVLPSGIDFPEARTQKLENDATMLLIRQGSQQVVRIELLFNAGNYYSGDALTAHAANDLMDEGTGKHNSAELAEALDYFGAYLHLESGNDWASLTLYSLSRYLPETLPLLFEILTEPSYPEHEITTFAMQGHQRLAVNLNKTDFLARRAFLKLLYSEQHPYGRMAMPEDYATIKSQTLKDFHQKNYLNGFAGAIIAGNFSETDERHIHDSIIRAGLKCVKTEAPAVDLPGRGSTYVTREGALQCAIRIGRRLFHRSHPHFVPFQVMNTILGGYFGSRLMSNIREDKGYTYGIGSGLISHARDGYFFISTEVGAEVNQAAIREIYLEIDRLRQDLVSIPELELVKNYMIGAFQRSIDGAFSLADRHKTLLLNSLDHTHFSEYVTMVRAVDPEQVREMAGQYLQAVDLTEAIVGP